MKCLGFPGSSDGKESACSAGDPGSILGQEDPLGEGAWQSTPVFLSGESHGQRWATVHGVTKNWTQLSD